MLLSPKKTNFIWLVYVRRYPLWKKIIFLSEIERNRIMRVLWLERNWLTSSLANSMAASLKIWRLPELLPQKTQTLLNLLFVGKLFSIQNRCFLSFLLRGFQVLFKLKNSNTIGTTMRRYIYILFIQVMM